LCLKWTGPARAIRILNGSNTQDTEDSSVVDPSLLTRSFPYPRHTINSALKNTYRHNYIYI
jgi:hypothetical protein